jgi:ribose transport system ATP-binding protein
MEVIMGKRVYLSEQKICKAFGPTRALVDVDITISRGEVHGLIGENGSGKSTFSSIVAGAQPKDSGELYIEGKPYSPKNMIDAQDHGISMIVQEMNTIPTISVASNILIGRFEQFTKFGIVNFREINGQANHILQEIGAGDIKAEAMTYRLNFEDRKIVEIARAMVSDPDLLIVDETTTALAHKGRTILYKLIKKMQEENKCVIFISHDLDELMSVCNCVTILRDGHVIETLVGREITVQKMRRLMVGRELSDNYFRDDFDGSYSDEVVLDACNVTYGIIEKLNIQLHKGEILGLSGLSACGMHELGQVLFGINRTLTGKVTNCIADVEINDPVVAVANRMAYVSKERDKEGIIINATILDNITLPSYDLLSGTLGYISSKDEMNLTQRQIDVMRIKCHDAKQRVSELSGGNKQKIVFAKWLARDCDIYILDCPTRGIDVGVKAFMYQLIYRLKKEGKSIIMISEELPELIGMSDRIVLMKDGRISKEIMRSADVTEQALIEHII